MTYIPNEEPYTDKYLSEQDKNRMDGYDFAVESIETAFANVVEDLETDIVPIDQILKGVIERIKEGVLDYLATDRQTCIVSFIDGYSDEELKERGWDK